MNVGNLGPKFLLPLLLSPILAVAVTTVIYPALRLVRQRMGIARDICLCVGKETVETFACEQQAVAMQRAQQLTATLGETVACKSRYDEEVLGISAGDTLDRCHFLSSGMVSFARIMRLLKSRDA